MLGFIEAEDGCVGVGRTEAEAKFDVYCQKCKMDLSFDTRKIFTERRELLHPWLPTSLSIHLSSIGYISYKLGAFKEARTGKVYLPAYDCKSIYTVLSNLLGSRLTYRDIMVVARKELDKFFYNSAAGCIPLDKMPTISVLGKNTEFKPSVEYTYGDAIIGTDSKLIGVTISDMDAFYCISKGPLNFVDSVIYLAYRLGYSISEEGVVAIGEEINEF